MAYFLELPRGGWVITPSPGVSYCLLFEMYIYLKMYTGKIYSNFTPTKKMKSSCVDVFLSVQKEKLNYVTSKFKPRVIYNAYKQVTRYAKQYAKVR